MPSDRPHIGPTLDPNEERALEAYIAALEAERDGLAAALYRSHELATIAATCEVEAAISHEPGTDVFGAVGIASKSRVARAKAAWKALDECIRNPAAILAARDERMKREGAIEALNQLIGAMVESDHVSLEYIQYRLAALVEEVGRG